MQGTTRSPNPLDTTYPRYWEQVGPAGPFLVFVSHPTFRSGLLLVEGEAVLEPPNVRLLNARSFLGEKHKQQV